MTTLTIGELARRTAVTPRALRLYERRGLLGPARTEGGRRVYGADEVARLAQVLALKDVGCTLATIARLMRARELDAAGLLGLWADRIEADRRRLARQARRLAAARRTVAAGDRLTVDALCDLLTGSDAKVGVSQALIDRWFTPDAQAQWQASGVAALGEDAEWQDLIGRVEDAQARGVSPDSPEAIALAVEWLNRMQPLRSAVGAAEWARGHAMYSTAISASGDDGLSEPMRRTYAFIFAAGDAARRQGALPASDSAKASLDEGREGAAR